MSGTLTSMDISRLEGKMDNAVDKINTVADRISRVEERALGALPALDVARVDMIALRVRVEILERSGAETRGQNRILALIWGVIVAAPGLISLWRNLSP